MTVVKRNKRARPDPELLKQLTKMLVKRALEAEMTEYLGHGKSGRPLARIEINIGHGAVPEVDSGDDGYEGSKK